MKTTTFLFAAALAGTVLIGCSKKDDGGGSPEQGLSAVPKEVTLKVSETKTITVSGSSKLNKPIYDATKISANLSSKPIEVTIVGLNEGKTDVQLTDQAGHSATIKVTVEKKAANNQSGTGDFQVNNTTLFLQKGVEVEITGRITKGSGSYKVSSKSSAVATIRQQGNKWYATGVGEGQTDKLIFEDVTTQKTIEVPVYVVIPFEAVDLPASVAVKSSYNVKLNGIYNTVTLVSNNGNAEATFIEEDIKNQVGQNIGKKIIGINLKGVSAGAAEVILKNGDEQTLKLTFNVVNFVAEDYFTVKDGVVIGVKKALPETVVLPDSATKVAAGAFVGQTAVKVIDFNNVTEIEGKLFLQRGAVSGGVVNVTTISIPKIKKIGDSAFRDAKKLQKVVFPASLTHLGTRAFWGCTELSQVAFRGTTAPKGLSAISTTLVNGAYDPAEEKATATDVFSTDSGNRVQLYIPIAQENAYKKALGESAFRAGGSFKPKDISEFK